MIDVQTLRKWLETIDIKNGVAVDGGGLSLVEVTPQGQLTGAYLEVGGVEESSE